MLRWTEATSSRFFRSSASSSFFFSPAASEEVRDLDLLGLQPALRAAQLGQGGQVSPDDVVLVAGEEGQVPAFGEEGFDVLGPQGELKDVESSELVERHEGPLDRPSLRFEGRPPEGDVLPQGLELAVGPFDGDGPGGELRADEPFPEADPVQIGEDGRFLLVRLGELRPEVPDLNVDLRDPGFEIGDVPLEGGAAGLDEKTDDESREGRSRVHFLEA